MEREEVTGTIASIFNDVLRIPLTEQDCGEAPASDISGCVHILGSQALVLTLDVNAALAERASMALLETDEPLDAADVPEAFAELLNIIAGNLTGMLDDARFTRPVVTRGAAISVPNARETMRVVFRDDRAGVLSYGIFPGVIPSES